MYSFSEVMVYRASISNHLIPEIDSHYSTTLPSVDEYSHNGRLPFVDTYTTLVGTIMNISCPEN
jgi:hypothetical protein